MANISSGYKITTSPEKREVVSWQPEANIASEAMTVRANITAKAIYNMEKIMPFNSADTPSVRVSLGDSVERPIGLIVGTDSRLDKNGAQRNAHPTVTATNSGMTGAIPTDVSNEYVKAGEASTSRAELSEEEKILEMINAIHEKAGSINTIEEVVRDNKLHLGA